MKKSISIFLISCLLSPLSMADTNIAWFNSVSANGKYIGFVNGKKLHVYHISDGQLVFQHQSPNIIASFGYSLDENKIAILSDNYILKAFVILSGNRVWTKDLKDHLDINRDRCEGKLAFTFDNKHIVVLGKEYSKAITYAVDANTGEYVAYQDELFDGSDLRYREITHLLTAPQGVYGFYAKGASAKAQVGQLRGGKMQLSAGEFVDKEGFVREFAIHDNGNVGVLSYQNKKSRDKFNLCYDYDFDFDIGYKRGKSRDVSKVKISNDATQFVAIAKDVASIYNFSTESNTGNEKKIRQFKVDVGLLAPIYFDAEKLIVGNIDEYIYKVINAKNGEMIGSYSKLEDMRYKGTAISKNMNTKESGVIFNDDFDDNVNDWQLIADEPNYAGVIEDGVLKLRAGYGKYSKVYNRVTGLDSYRSFEIEATMKGSGGDFGLFWGRNSRSGIKNQILLNENGTYSFGKSDAKNEPLSIPNWKPITVYSDKMNTIKITYQSNVCSITVNGQQLDAIGVLGTFGEGFGFLYSSDATVVVDEIKASYLSSDVLGYNIVMAVDFSNGIGWTQLEGGEGQIENGVLVMENNGSQTAELFVKGMALDYKESFQVEYVFKIEGELSENAGIMAIPKNGKGSTKLFTVDDKNGFNINNQYLEFTNDGNSEAYKTGEYNKLTIRKERDKISYYINHKLVEYYNANKIESTYMYLHGFQIPKQSTIKVKSIMASYLNKDKFPSSKCQIFIAKKIGGNTSTRPVTCSSYAVFDDDMNFNSKVMRENELRLEYYDSWSEFNLRTKGNYAIGRISNTLKCKTRPCKM